MGRVDIATLEGGRLKIVGWMLSPSAPPFIDKVALYLEGKKLAETPCVIRGDVFERYRDVAHSKQCGFVFEVDLEEVKPGPGKISIVGFNGNRPVAEMRGRVVDLATIGAAAPPDLEMAVGHFDEVRFKDSVLILEGWMFSPDTPLDLVGLYWEGRGVAATVLCNRPDVSAAHKWIPHAGNSGFSFYCELGNWRHSYNRVSAVGYSKNRAVCRMSTLIREDGADSVPLPPVDLIQRVSGLSCNAFRLDGLKIYSDLIEQVIRYRNPGEIRRMLDWGCGCGRVTMHFFHWASTEIFGCDIDPEAVAWCNSNLRAGRFDRVGTAPPTAYPDAHFDLVVACSVFTHLSEANQAQWLQEMRRIIAPGGLLLASTHGQFAYDLDRYRSLRYRSLEIGRRVFPHWGRRPITLSALKPFGSGGPSKSAPVASDNLDGIVEVSLKGNLALEGIAPRNYYLGVYQSRQFTEKTWGRYFEILDYIERGLNAHQDLIVLRRSQ